MSMLSWVRDVRGLPLPMAYLSFDTAGFANLFQQFIKASSFPHLFVRILSLVFDNRSVFHPMSFLN